MLIVKANGGGHSYSKHSLCPLFKFVKQFLKATCKNPEKLDRMHGYSTFNAAR